MIYILQAKPIQELRQKLIPEIQALIKQNRINYLISGTRFNKFASKGMVSASANTLKVRFRFNFPNMHLLTKKCMASLRIIQLTRINYVLYPIYFIRISL